MRKLGISAISYLNTAPLMWDFEHGTAGEEFDVSYTLPSLCAEAVRKGTADIGIIPAAAYAVIPDLEILPGVAIASRREVQSILLVSKVPLENIRTVGLDTSSMTSVALLKVLFSKWWGGNAIFEPMAPELDQMLAEHDAGLLIGDPALKVNRSRYVTYDLAQEWIRLTGKPFVFAFWAIRQAALGSTYPRLDLTAVFQASRDHGLMPDNLARLARDWAGRLDLSESQVMHYLTDNIHYYLDADCIEGLELFYRYAEECGALPCAPELHFLDVPRAALK
jgi:chorismate dehydratase